MRKLVLSLLLAASFTGVFAQKLDDIKEKIQKGKYDEAKEKLDKVLADPKNFLRRRFRLPRYLERIVSPVLGTKDLDAHHPVVPDLVEVGFDLADRQDTGAGIEAMGIGQLFFWQVLGVVDVEYEKLFRLHRVDGLIRRIAGVEMKRVEDVPDALAIHLLDYLVAKVERLDRAVRLTEEFESQRDAVWLRDVG